MYVRVCKLTVPRGSSKGQGRGCITHLDEYFVALFSRSSIAVSYESITMIVVPSAIALIMSESEARE